MNAYLRPAFLLLVLLLLLQLLTNAQPGATGAGTGLRAIYRLDYRPDSAVATPKRVLMILRTNNGASCFQGKHLQVLDSVYVSLSDRPEKERLQKALDATRKPGKNEFHYTIFKEPSKNLVSYHDAIGYVDYQYLENAPLFHWEIKPAKKIVAGYECQQAFTAFGGRTWEAWFTRDIPVSEGPYKFYGLPGLILQVRDTHDNYVFELLSVGHDDKPFDISAVPDSPMSAKPAAPLIKKAKFLQAKRNEDLTIFDRFAAIGNIIPSGMQKDYFEKLKRQNNLLELK